MNRPYYLLIFFLLLVNINFTIAQSSFDEAKFGIKGGVLSAAIGGDVATFGIGKPMLGGILLLPAQESFDLKVEALFTGQGAGDANRRVAEGQWNYVYLNVPVLLSFHPFGDTRIKLDAGLQAGFLLDAWYRDRNVKVNIDFETRNFDLSVAGGGAFHFEERWGVDLRLVVSLRDHSLRTWTGDRYYNQSLQLGVFYILN